MRLLLGARFVYLFIMLFMLLHLKSEESFWFYSCCYHWFVLYNGCLKLLQDHYKSDLKIAQESAVSRRGPLCKINHLFGWMLSVHLFHINWFLTYICTQTTKRYDSWVHEKPSMVYSTDPVDEEWPKFWFSCILWSVYKSWYNLCILSQCETYLCLLHREHWPWPESKCKPLYQYLW